MGLAFRNNSQRFKKPVGFPTTNVRTGLYGEYVFGGNQADSVINTAGITDMALFSGNNVAIDYTNAHAVVKSGTSTVGGFATGVNNLTDDFTLIQVAQGSNAKIGCEHDASGPSNFWAMYGLGDGGLKASNKDYYSQVTLANTGIVLANYYFCAFRSPLTGNGALMRYVDGALQSADLGVTSRAGLEIKIGGFVYNSDYGSGSNKIAYTAIYTRTLSDAEIATVYANLKAYLTNYRGLTVS